METAKRRRWPFAVIGFIAGALLSGGIVAAIANQQVNAAIKIADNSDNNIGQYQQGIADCSNRLQKLVKDSNAVQQRLNDENSQGTILYEPAPPQQIGIQLFHGLVEVSPGSKVAIPQQLGKIPRWWIPAKIMPTVYGDAGGMTVFYFNPATRRLDGPYIPQVAPKE